MTSFYVPVKHPSHLTPEATTTHLEKVPDLITQLDLTKHTWDSLQIAIIVALRTPNQYNIGLEGHGLAWEAWLDEFLEGGVGDRFWPENGMLLSWKYDQAVIREAVKTQVLLITTEERQEINTTRESSDTVRGFLETAEIHESDIDSIRDHENLSQQPRFSDNPSPIQDEPDKTKIHTRRTRATTKKLHGLGRPKRWDFTPAVSEAKPEDRDVYGTKQKDVNIETGDGEDDDPPRLRRGPVRRRKATGWVAVNEVGEGAEYIHDKLTTRKLPATKQSIPKRRRRNIPTSQTPNSSIKTPSEVTIKSETLIPTPCLASTAPSTPTSISASSSLVLETRLATSPKMKFIYAVDTPSLSHFLERVRQKWMLSATQRVSSIEIEVGSKVFEVDIKEERDWKAILGIVEEWGERIEVMIKVTG